MSSAIQIAQRYFELSNAANLQEIRRLFSPSSTYSSANTGVHLGVDRIMAMQSTFYSSFDTLSWTIHSVEEVSPGVVFFEFTFSGKTKQGEAIEKDGKEFVVIYQERIQHVEVRNT